MASEAVAGQNRLHILIEINTLRRSEPRLPAVAACRCGKQHSEKEARRHRGQMRRFEPINLMVGLLVRGNCRQSGTAPFIGTAGHSISSDNNVCPEVFGVGNRAVS
jgi:hypothetical protein